ncbi:Ig-like domain-containing protein [Chitinophaga sp. Hz27]|uniref:Ig-like domain-containing protein n=1 Tax=Chitinophaga sp. Hz27 TaxID=3347169 RepID=UPI0035D7873E
MRYLFILIPLIFCFLSTNAQFKGLVVNEFSQGDAGTKEYFELVVAGTRTCTQTTADIRGWIFDDQNGWYGGTGTGIAQGHMRFANDPNWAAIPFGSIIVLYNADDVNTVIASKLTPDLDDSNHDGVYVVPIGKTSVAKNLIDVNTALPVAAGTQNTNYVYGGTYSKLSAAGATAWQSQVGLSNSGDAVITVDPNAPGVPFFSITFGLSPTPKTPTVQLGAVAGSKNAYLKDGASDNYTNVANWVIGNANTNETPGEGNTPENKAWIASMRQDPAPPTQNTGNNTICVGATTQLSNATAGGSWSSANTAIATVDPTSGLVTGVAQGTVDITYTIGGCKAITTVIVNAGATTPVITGQATMCTGTTATFTVNNTTGSWSSSNTAVATVDASGLVTAVSTGTVSIQYTISTCGGATGSYTVNVTAAITPGAIGGPATVCKGATITLTNPVAGGAWTSSDNTIASIDNTTGVLTGVATGNVTVTYTLSGACQSGTATFIVSVNDKPAQPVITGNTNVCKDADITLTADIANGTWMSSDNTIATVDATTGLVHGVAGGTATITYTVTNTCGSNANSYSVVVNTVPVVQPITGSANICMGTNTNAYTDATPGGTWSSNNNSIATVDVNGNVIPVATGSFILSYTVPGGCGNGVATLNVTVGDVPADATITGAAGVCIGATTALNVDKTGGSWSSSDNTIATVDPTTGLVTGVSTGNVIITYTQTNTCGTKPNTHTIAVSAGATAANIAGSTNICTGANYTYTNATPGGTWSSSNNAIATVDVNGSVTPKAAGNFILSYTVSSGCGDDTKTLAITVTATPIDAVISGPATVCTGSAITLTADQAGGSWSSSNNAVATVVNTTGVVSGVTSGNVIISYNQSNSCGTKTNTQSVTVNEAPVLTAIGGSTSICKGNTYAYTNTTAGGSWKSSDNSIATVDITGNVTPVAAGSFTLTYTVSSACGDVSQTLFITVGDKPALGSINGANSVCVGATIVLTNSTPAGSWVSTDNTIATVDVNGTVKGIAAGTVDISYAVSNTCGTSTQTKTIIVNAQPVVAAIIGSNAICTGATATYTNATVGGNWSSSDNSIATVSTTGVVTPVAKGSFTLNYTVNSVCGNVTQGLLITVNSKPVLNATTGVNTICVGGNVTLNNAFVGGTWSSSNTAIATVDVTGKVTAFAIGTADIYYSATNGCGTTQIPFTITVSDKPVVPVISGVTDICKNAQTNFTNTLTGGQWSSADNSIATVNATTGAVSGVSAGTTNIIYTVTNTCGNSAQSHAITVNDIPVVAPINGIADICQNTGIQLSNTIANGKWTSSNNAIVSVDNSGWATGLAIGTADITYTVDNKGCVGSTTSTIHVQGLKLMLSSSPETIIAGKSFTVTSTGDAAYTVTAWKPAALFTNQVAKQQTVTLYDQTPVVITVEGKTSAGCLASATITVAAVPNSNDFFVPNAFTPNGDGRNDVFKAYGSGIKEITLQVYTQWGEKVYEGNDAAKGWDGTYKGRQQPVGVYVYALKAIMLDGAVITKKGSVNLIR